MKLGKKNEYDDMVLVECEHGMEVKGTRTEEELREDGYKNACEIERPSDSAICEWLEYTDCWVQVWSELETIIEEE